ncbi:MAG TPA: hypothetical protein VLG40_01355 [Candidatus Saccharimonas sp.]|nr:hypothetical protein [Candidatus Saccharimonas sp.]
MTMHTGPDGLRQADDLFRFVSQQHELLQRVVRGTLDIAVARRGLQHLILGEPIASCQPSPYFVSLAQQIANVETWNEQFGWGFSAELVARRCLEARTFDWPGDQLQAIVLVPSLETPAATLLALMTTMSDKRRRNGALQPWPMQLLDRAAVDPSCVKLLDGAEFRPNSLEWRFVDLGSHLSDKASWGADGHLARASDFVTPQTAAHAEVLAAAAHFPDWVKAITNGDAPGVMIPGYRLLQADHSNVDRTNYLSIYFAPGDVTAMLHGTSSESMFGGRAIATAGPVPLGKNL